MVSNILFILIKTREVDGASFRGAHSTLCRAPTLSSSLASCHHPAPQSPGTQLRKQKVLVIIPRFHEMWRDTQKLVTFQLPRKNKTVDFSKLSGNVLNKPYLMLTNEDPALHFTKRSLGSN